MQILNLNARLIMCVFRTQSTPRICIPCPSCVQMEPSSIKSCSTVIGGTTSTAPRLLDSTDWPRALSEHRATTEKKLDLVRRLIPSHPISVQVAFQHVGLPANATLTAQATDSAALMGVPILVMEKSLKYKVFHLPSRLKQHRRRQRPATTTTCPR